MPIDQHALAATGQRLVQAHNTLCEARLIIEEAGTSSDKIAIDDALQIGAKLGIFFGLLQEGIETDESPLQELAEYCEIAESVGQRFGIALAQ